MFLSMHYPPKNKVEVSLCNLADFVSGILLVTAQQEKQSKSADKTAPLGRKTVRSGVVVFAMKLLDGVFQCLSGLEGGALRRRSRWSRRWGLRP